MSVIEAKAIYIMLRDSGELELMFPQATGDWFEDKVKFIEAYNKNLEMLYADLDISSEEDYYEDDL